jgi:hypothetical protein
MLFTMWGYSRARPFLDVRLQRLVHMIDPFADPPDGTIPRATGHRRDMDAAYAFSANPRGGPAGVLRPGSSAQVKTRSHAGRF